jgi:hypothetical protein
MYRNINEESDHIRQKNGYCWLTRLSHESHETWLIYNDCKAAARSEILKKKIKTKYQNKTFSSVS